MKGKEQVYTSARPAVMCADDYAATHEPSSISVYAHIKVMWISCKIRYSVYVCVISSSACCIMHLKVCDFNIAGNTIVYGNTMCAKKQCLPQFDKM